MFLLLLSSTCTEPRPFLLFVLLDWWGEWEDVGGWEQTQLGQVTKGIFQTTEHHAQDIKQGEEEEERMFGVMAFVLPSHHYVWWDPAVLEMDALLLAHEKQWIIFLFCFVCKHRLCFLYWTVFILAHEFSNFYTLPILSPILLKGEWASGCKGLGCWLELNCNKAIKDYESYLKLKLKSEALYVNTLKFSSCIWPDHLRLMHISCQPAQLCTIQIDFPYHKEPIQNSQIWMMLP